MTQKAVPEDLFDTARRELSSSVIGDVMDKLGLQHQFLPPAIRPLRPEMTLVGRAAPVLSVNVYEESVSGAKNNLMHKPFGLMLEALDDLRTDEIYVCDGASQRNALWGELMTIRARQVGCAGAVLNGYQRDTRSILAMRFPIFSWGSYGQDSAPRYKVVDYRVTIEIGCVRIRPGDILFGDADGVCVIPIDGADDVFSRAFEKVRGEKLVRQALEGGQSAVAAFEQYGIM